MSARKTFSTKARALAKRKKGQSAYKVVGGWRLRSAKKRKHSGKKRKR